MKRMDRDIAAVVFDLDDTLYPEIQYVRSGFRAVARELAEPGKRQSVEATLDLLFEIFRTGKRDRIFNVALARLGKPADEATVRRLVRIYRGHIPALQIDPAVSNALAVLRERFTLALLSDGYLPAQQLKLDALRVGPMFKQVLFTERLGRQYWKPHPRAFEEIARDLAASPERCVYVADNPAKDFLAPNRLGWATVQVDVPSRIHTAAAPTRDHRAHFNCRFQDLPDLLIG